MRRTLWVVAVDDAPVVMVAAAADVAVTERRKLQGLLEGLTGNTPVPAWLADLERRVLGLMADGQARRTAELSREIPRLQTQITLGSGKWSGQAPLSSRLLFLLAMEGHLVRGPSATWRSSQYAWVATGTWFADDDAPTADAASANTSTADAARTALARRYLASFGPATSLDLKWWTGWTVKRTAAALAAVGAVEITTEDGPAWVLPGDLPAADPPPHDAPLVTLLPSLDPTANGLEGPGLHHRPAHPAAV
ncbi:hypothetical protein BH23ACT9_BH23ACT9_33190 [soil metagenome]